MSIEYLIESGKERAASLPGRCLFAGGAIGWFLCTALTIAFGPIVGLSAVARWGVAAVMIAGAVLLIFVARWVIRTDRFDSGDVRQPAPDVPPKAGDKHGTNPDQLYSKPPAPPSPPSKGESG